MDVMTRGGHKNESTWEIILFMQELENMNLLGPDGKPEIQSGDRIQELQDRHGNTIISFPEPPGMYVHEAGFQGYGLAAFKTPKVNLFALVCRPEQKGSPE